MADESPARITRVRLKNYKSIVSCDVELRPLTILVGPNGSGKSNFLDALRFVSETLTVGLEQAIRNRGNVQHMLSLARPAGTSTFGIEVDFRLATGGTGTYAFEVEALPDADFKVVREQLFRQDVSPPIGPELFSIHEDGAFMWSSDDVANRYPDSPYRLFLVAYSAMEEAKPVYDLLTSTAFYNPSPEAMSRPQEHEQGLRLLPDGRNVASVLRRIEATKPETAWRVNKYLSRVLPGLEAVTGRDLGGYDSLEFHQRVANEDGVTSFTPRQMSDGTLRALAILVALFQGRMGGKSAVSLVGIEEPESGLHPAVAGALLNALIDASETSQVLVTTHGTDLLDNDDVDVESLLAVLAEDGVTHIGPIDQVGRSLLRDRLYTVGELLHFDQLRPAIAERGSAAEPTVRDPSPVPR